MKFIILVFTLLCSVPPSLAQSEPDFEKLATACRAWGLIKYFHPDRPSYVFDSAFAAQVPAMLAANSDEAWEQALRKWLRVLEDTTTEVVKTQDATADQAAQFYKRFLPDSLLLIKMDGAQFFNNYFAAEEFLVTALQEATQAKGVIFDIRQSAEIPTDYQGAFSLNFGYFDINRLLSTNASPPQYRSLYYSGFIPERGGSSGGYSQHEVLTSLPKASSEGINPIPTVWVTNQYSELPDVAIAEQAMGNAFIIHDSPDLLPLLPVISSLPFGDNYVINFKTRDVVGISTPLKADTVYYNSDDPLEIARKLLLDSTQHHPPIQTASGKSTRPDKDYPSNEFPEVGYRVLAAAKIFTVIDHFFPYQEYMDRDWYEVLVEYLPQFVFAKNEMDYGQAVAKMYAHIQDSHGFISGNPALSALFGEASSPLSVGWVENKVVVTSFRDSSVCQEKGIAVGDIILKIDGIPVEELMNKYRTFYAHSTPQSINHRAARLMVRGPEGKSGVFTIRHQDGDITEVTLFRKETYEPDRYAEYATQYPFHHALDTLAFLSETIGYADLTRMVQAQTDSMFNMFRDTKAIVLDMRGYPNGTAWSIAPRLTEEKNVPLALFRKREVLHPNIREGEVLSTRAYTEFIQTISASTQWKYQGKTVMLINHDAVSQSEHSGLFFKSVDSTTFIGTPTMGANGDVTNFEIPGGMFLSFSGQGVWHVDGKQLQRLGLQPDVYVAPTIEGIRQGKDEVMERAIHWIEQNIGQ